MSDQTFPNPVQPKKTALVISFILGSCLGMILAFAGSICLVAVFMSYVIQTPDGLEVSYDLPPRVTVGESFDLRLRITNQGQAEIPIGDIDLQSFFMPTILEGVVVTGTEPNMEKDYSVKDIKTFRFNDGVSPGESITVIFHLQAVRAGEFEGPVKVYSGMQSADVYPSIVISE